MVRGKHATPNESIGSRHDARQISIVVVQTMWRSRRETSVDRRADPSCGSTTGFKVSVAAAARRARCVCVRHSRDRVAPRARVRPGDGVRVGSPDRVPRLGRSSGRFGPPGWVGLRPRGRRRRRAPVRGRRVRRWNDDRRRPTGRACRPPQAARAPRVRCDHRRPGSSSVDLRLHRRWWRLQWRP